MRTARFVFAYARIVANRGYPFDAHLDIRKSGPSGACRCALALGERCGYALLLRSRMQRDSDTIVFELAYARSVVEADAVGKARLVLVSDTPFPLGEPDSVGFVGRSFGSRAAEHADMVLHRNACGICALEKVRGGRWPSAR